MRIFIGYDPIESIAYHVLAHSILERASRPVAITPVGNTVLHRAQWQRKRGEHDSTAFSNARFMVPHMAGYDGWAVFMDCDMLCLADIWHLNTLAEQNPHKAILVRQHDHHPDYSQKFLGTQQTNYERKNWSSLMLMNCGLLHKFLPGSYVNEAPGLDLHRFAWCPDELIGEIPAGWNTLVEHGKNILPEDEAAEPKLVHFTQGGPWHGYLNQPYAAEWTLALEYMLMGTNPRACVKTDFSVRNGRLRLDLDYSLDTGRPGERVRHLIGSVK